MGICCSKKKQQPLSPSPPPPPLAEKKEKNNVAVDGVEVEKKKKKRNDTKTTTITAISRTSTQTQLVAEAEKKPVAVTAPSSNSSEEKQETKAVPVAEPRPAAAVRTSSCTKEEVDAILIQCGRLSRSSSGNTNNGHRRHSGSKRSYDFDNDNDKSSTSKDEDEDWEEAKPVPRPSPHRRTPGREREHYKRSGSRERGRGGTGSPRVSRSPGRRSDGPGSSDKPRQQQQQPGKLVSLPAREKGGVKRNAASSRSNSPAKNATKLANENALHQPQPQPQSLSRSSSRKGEESPSRRNPMAEIDTNSLRPNQKAPKSREGGEEASRKPSPVRSQRTGDKRSGGATSTEVPKGSNINNNNNNNNNISNYVREQLMSCRANEKLRESETRGARTLTRTRSSRRSSKDFDHLVVGPNSENAPPNPNSYASLLLEDIQNYHQQSAASAPFSLPACVSKACSILDAVADLNSSSSDYSNNDNVRLGRGSFSGEPSETEPQESAGSNSFPVQSPWANSADSTDRRWTPRPDDAEEEVAFDSQGKGSRGGGGSGSSSSTMTPGKKREAYVKSGGNRARSLPVVVAAVTS